MEFSLSFEEQEIQKEAAKFARKTLLPIHKDIERDGKLPPVVHKAFCDMEILRLPFPEEAGGAGGTFTGLMLAVKELAYACLVPPNMLLENYVLAWPVWEFGTPAMRDAFLEDLLSLKAVGALAFTEPDTGSDPVQLKTTAVKADGGWVLNGTKRFITYSGTCDQVVVFAKTPEGGVGAFLIESKNPGYKLGRRESFMHVEIDNGDILLENCFVPDAHTFGGPAQGFEVLLRTETLGKVGFCAVFAGVMERAMDLALEYALTKTHRDKAIGHKFQMVQVKLAEMAALAEATRAYLYYVCALVDKGRDVFMEAAALKLLVGENLRRIAGDALELHGAYGLSDEYGIGRIYKMAMAPSVVMGGLDLQRVIVAKTLLGQGTYSGR
jgi:alkylation response protein AidB-like acyl-CoA dehydrogenase